MAVYKVIELVGTSETSWEKAAASAVARLEILVVPREKVKERVEQEEAPEMHRSEAMAVAQMATTAMDRVAGMRRPL